MLKAFENYGKISNAWDKAYELKCYISIILEF
jgi:hypothetical protein